MSWAALIFWIVTAGGGFVLFGIWLKNGGMQQSDRGRIRPVALVTHLLLAATGLVLWMIYVASDSSALAWVAFVLLLVVALIGFGMFGIWASQRRRSDDAAAEQHFPVGIVGLHGILAATTLVLVLLAALGVGGS
jgi:hypothetical protein